MAEVIVVDETQSTTAAASPDAKRKRFRFKPQLDLLLCKAVMETKAHAPPVNKKMEVMGEARNLFISGLPAAVRETYSEPKVKTISDRFDLIANHRRDEDRKNSSASGISEEKTELNDILDDLILQRDEDDESRRKVREEKTELDKKLDVDAEEIRSQATSRMSRPQVEEGEEGERKKRKVVSIDSDDEELELLKKSLAERRENERTRMEL